MYKNVLNKIGIFLKIIINKSVKPPLIIDYSHSMQ